MPIDAQSTSLGLAGGCDLPEGGTGGTWSRAMSGDQVPPETVGSGPTGGVRSGRLGGSAATGPPSVKSQVAKGQFLTLPESRDRASLSRGMPVPGLQPISD